MAKAKLGIRPIIDGRWGGVRESLEEKTMSMALAAKKLIEENVFNSDGTPFECIISPCTIGGAAEAAKCADFFSTQNVCATLSVTPCWCYGSETMDLDPLTVKAVWGFNGTERPGAVYLAAVLAAHAQRGLPAFSIYGKDVQDVTDNSIPDDVAEKILRFARCAAAVGQLRGKSYVGIGAVAMGIAGSYCDADFWQEYLGIRAEWVDMVEVTRRVELGIYDHEEYERALKWVKENCPEGFDKNPENIRHTPEQKEKEWEFVVKMTLICRDIMLGNDKLNSVRPAGAEQDPDEWWSAMCNTTKRLMNSTSVSTSEIAGISFCSQMQGLVLVDKDGVPVRMAMSYMDQRAKKQIKELMAYGPQIAGANIPKLLKSLQITGAVSASVKDPVYKYKWVEENEPENFARTYKWLDVKEYIICRMTDKFVMTRDSAFGTLLYDVRKGREGWSSEMLKMFNVKPEHMADIIDSTALVGGLTERAAGELGLCEGTPVFGGGGDASLIGVGAGAVALGDTHIYCGTSGWVTTVVDKNIVDTSAMIAAIVGAQNGKLNYFAELETAGKCLEWVKDHLALDEIDIFLEKTDVASSKESIFTSLYDYMSHVINKTPAGCGGVIFTPWLHGNRCPFEDPNARGMFFNISLETGKTELIRAVVEGTCMHLRWFLETEDKKTKTSDVLRFVGGGALSDVTSQILADCTGRTVEVVASPQNVGAVGAAVISAVGLGMIGSIEEAKKLVPAKKTFIPNPSLKPIYDKNFAVFKNLYKSNKENFAALNG